MATGELKQSLWNSCQQFIEARITAAKQAMQAAQEAANAEGKSSAGDKYETTRALMQTARDQAAQQLDEALRMNKLLDSVKLVTQSEKVGSGNVVFCDTVNFYIAISAGKLKVDGVEFIAVSTQAPIAHALMNLSAGSNFQFNGRQHVIQKIV